MTDQSASAVSPWWGRASAAAFGAAGLLLLLAGMVDGSVLAWSQLGEWSARGPVGRLGIRHRAWRGGGSAGVAMAKQASPGRSAAVVGLATWAGIAWLLESTITLHGGGRHGGEADPREPDSA